MMLLHTLLKHFCSRLESAGLETPRLDAEVLLTKALGISRESFWRDSGRCLTEEETRRCESFLHRREAREPLAYITGEQEFWSRAFRVTPDVLIPRPETEILIEQLLKEIPAAKRQDPVSGLDMCTGSGVLAITAALELPQARMFGVDISATAISVASDNAKKHNVGHRIDWVISDLFVNLDTTSTSVNALDFILCNPPYISTEDCRHLQPEIRQYEPSGALDGGLNGLDFFSGILEGAQRFLKPGGRLLMEIGCDQGHAVCSLLKNGKIWNEVDLIQDYSGRDRVVSAYKRMDG